MLFSSCSLPRINKSLRLYAPLAPNPPFAGPAARLRFQHKSLELFSPSGASTPNENASYPHDFFFLSCSSSSLKRPYLTIILSNNCRAAIHSSNISLIPSGGGKEVRTPDLRLAKPSLSRLSYTPDSVHPLRRWWAWEDSNFRPHAYQACALTT